MIMEILQFSIEKKLRACIRTRELASEALAQTLTQLLNTDTAITEAMFRDKWLENMAAYEEIFPKGWYDPPPYGIGVLFATEKNYTRMNYKSLRPEENWPKDNVVLDRNNGVFYVYASPVHKHTGMIGDIGLSLYLGNNQKYINHLKTCLQLNNELFEAIDIGMRFSDIARLCAEKCNSLGLTNEVMSITDPAGMNIGHTVPSSFEPWSSVEMTELNSGDWKKTCKAISKKRNFVSAQENLEVRRGMAFTLEPRLTKYMSPHIPMSSFHSIVIIHENGTKKLLTGFDKIFTAVGMSYMV